MNVIRAIKQYVIKMTEQSGPGMKILLLDKQTTSIVSMVFPQSEMLQMEVYMFENIEITSQCDYENMKHLKCIAMLRPTKDNIALLCKELKNPKFGSYYIYFTSIIPKADIKTLAEFDEQESVREIEELYADYLPILPHFFSLNIPLCSNGHIWDPIHLVRTTQGLVGLLLSLNKNPIIRYQASSEMSRRLAEKVKETIIKEDKLFDMRQGEGVPVLLIIDRTCDPITPLLTQWTYQAMVHELLTINNNRVDLSHVTGVSPELKQVVLNFEHDDFYSSNLFMNYGEIGQTIKLLMDDFTKKAQSHQKVESIADMKAFVENYPMFKKMSGTVSKHVAVVSELSSIVGQRNLLEVSELEQELACQEHHSVHLPKLRTLLSSGKVRDIDAVRLVMLYAIRYEHHTNNDLSGLLDILRRIGINESLVQMPLQVLDYSNEHSKYSHNNDKFSSTQDVMVKKTQRFLKELKGVENVYTQHEPVLKDILDDLVKGKLKENLFPYLDQGFASGTRWVQDVIVFMVGGTTYEECLTVHQMNTSSGSSVRGILLGGTTVHNSTSFMHQRFGDLSSCPYVEDWTEDSLYCSSRKLSQKTCSQ